MKLEECKPGMRVSKIKGRARCYGTLLRLSCEPVQPVVKWDHVASIQYINPEKLSEVNERHPSPEMIIEETLKAHANSAGMRVTL
jgi:hypothetical protein